MFLTDWVRLLFSSDRSMSGALRQITGFTPRDLTHYQLAFQHSSLVRNQKESAFECNERLEFLGDAVLGSVVAEYLYKKYPTRSEGFLTDMRSKLVNRTSLNSFSLKLGLDQFIKFDARSGTLNQAVYGNTLEAFIGAIYLDQGYKTAKRFIYRRILNSLADVDALAVQDYNYKSRLMEFAQKNKLKPVTFELVEEKFQGMRKHFTVAVKIGAETYGTGTDTKKKLAEQSAAEMALSRLQPKYETVDV